LQEDAGDEISLVELHLCRARLAFRPAYVVDHIHTSGTNLRWTRESCLEKLGHASADETGKAGKEEKARQDLAFGGAAISGFGTSLKFEKKDFDRVTNLGNLAASPQGIGILPNRIIFS